MDQIDGLGHRMEYGSLPSYHSFGIMYRDGWAELKGDAAEGADAVSFYLKR